MGTAVSVFILDVTNSSKFRNGQALSEYLSEWQDVIANNNTIKIAVKHRMGDEIICVVEGYSNALVIANYMVYNWKYEDNMPYFGISFGVIEDNINTIDIDKWNNMLVKNARLANNLIKEDKTRTKLIEMNPLNKFENIERQLINSILNLQSAAILKQTTKQREILGLYSLLRSQKEVALILNKSTSTVWEHFTVGKTDLILDASESLYDLLNSKEIQLNPENKILEKQKKFEQELRRNIEQFRLGQEYK